MAISSLNTFLREVITLQEFFFSVQQLVGSHVPDQGLTCTLGTENNREKPTPYNKVQLFLTGKAPFPFSMKSFLLPLIKYNLIPLKSSQIFLFPPLIINHTKKYQERHFSSFLVWSIQSLHIQTTDCSPSVLFMEREPRQTRLFREGAYILLAKSIRPWTPRKQAVSHSPLQLL